MMVNSVWAAITSMALQDYIFTIEAAVHHSNFLALVEETKENKIYKSCSDVTANFTETMEKCKKYIRADNSYEYNVGTLSPQSLTSCDDGTFLLPNVLNYHPDQTKYFDELSLTSLQPDGDVSKWYDCFPLQVRGTEAVSCYEGGMPINEKVLIGKERAYRLRDISLSSQAKSLVIETEKGCKITSLRAGLSLRNRGGVSRFLQDTARPQLFARTENGRIRQCMLATNDLGQTLKECNSVLAGATSYQYVVPIAPTRITVCPQPDTFLLSGILHHDDKQSEVFHSVTLSHFKFRDIVKGHLGFEWHRPLVRYLEFHCGPFTFETVEGTTCAQVASNHTIQPLDLKAGGEHASMAAPSTHTSILIEFPVKCSKWLKRLEAAQFPSAILTFEGNQTIELFNLQDEEVEEATQAVEVIEGVQNEAVEGAAQALEVKAVEEAAQPVEGTEEIQNEAVAGAAQPVEVIEGVQDEAVAGAAQPVEVIEGVQVEAVAGAAQPVEVIEGAIKGSFAAKRYEQLGSLLGASSASILISAATIAFY